MTCPGGVSCLSIDAFVNFIIPVGVGIIAIVVFSFVSGIIRAKMWEKRNLDKNV